MVTLPNMIIKCDLMDYSFIKDQPLNPKIANKCLVYGTRRHLWELPVRTHVAYKAEQLSKDVTTIVVTTTTQRIVMSHIFIRSSLELLKKKADELFNSSALVRFNKRIFTQRKYKTKKEDFYWIQIEFTPNILKRCFVSFITKELSSNHFAKEDDVKYIKEDSILNPLEIM